MLKINATVPNLWIQLTFVGIVMLFLMTLYEGFKQFVCPDISIWGSHLITILFTSFLAVMIFNFILRQFHLEYAKRMEEIVQRNASQAALKHSEERWHSMVENARVGVFQAKPDGGLVMANNKLAHMLGYDDSTELTNMVGDITNLYMYPEDRRAIIDQLASNKLAERTEIELKDKKGRSVWMLLNARVCQDPSGNNLHEGFLIDISDKKRLIAEKNRIVVELEESLAQVKFLSGMLPICCNCKKIRDDQGYWNQIERYIESRTDAKFSHSCCPDCARKLYPWMKPKTGMDASR